MSIYFRYKQGPEGFRAIVSLLESAPPEKQMRMIEAGMAEDPDFTRKVLLYLYSFNDLVTLPDEELGALVNAAPSKLTAFAIATLSEVDRKRFLQLALPRIRSAIEEQLDLGVLPAQSAGAKYKLIEVARSLEKEGDIRTKKLPD